jgi:hypothetical protein
METQGKQNTGREKKWKVKQKAYRNQQWGGDNMEKLRNTRGAG